MNEEEDEDINDRKESPKRKHHHKHEKEVKEQKKGTDSKEDTGTEKLNSDEIEAGYRESDEAEPEEDQILTE